MSSLPEQIETEKRFSRSRAYFSWTFFRFVVAAIILTAAGMKAHQLATTPSLGEGLLHTRWLNILVVEFELFFGIWLIFGLLPKLTWLVTVGCFMIFAVVSLYKALSGEASCGCFGAATVNPWYTAVFDLFAIALLLKLRPIGNLCEIFPEIRLLPKYRNRSLAIAFVWMVFATPATFAMFSIESSDVAELGTEFIGADGRKTILLEPEKWVGKEFPLLERLTPNSDVDKVDMLRHGSWIIVFVHQTCPKCKEWLKTLKDDAQNDNSAIIVLPPFQNTKDVDAGFSIFKTNNKEELFLTTPCEIHIEDGVVKDFLYL